MWSFLRTALVSLGALTALAAGYPDPLPCSGTCTDTHDPSLIRRASDGTYFRFATGGLIPIFTSKLLLGPWSYAGTVLEKAADIADGNTDLWAPDVHLVDDEYYLFYAGSTFGSQDSVVGLATSKTLEPGSWTDHGAVISSTTGSSYNAIDPNLFRTSSDDYVLNFGSFWNDINQIGMKASTPTATEGSARQIAYNATAAHSEEGSYMIERDGFYYLFFSAGQCCNLVADPAPPGDEYSIRVCRSESYNAGFVDQTGRECTESGGTMVLPSHGEVYAPGGQGLYEDSTYGWIIYYHYLNTTISEEDADVYLGINKVSFSSGWPVLES